MSQFSPFVAQLRCLLIYDEVAAEHGWREMLAVFDRTLI
jgi:hypothetical protein